MPQIHRRLLTCAMLIVAGVSPTRPLLAAKPAADLLPATTRFYVSVPDVETFRTSFRQTDLGELANDPVMKPFADDLARQVRERLGNTEAKLGLTLEDLEGVYGGEACLGLIQPGGDPSRHAIALLVDVTGHRGELDKLLTAVGQSMRARNATKLPARKIGDVDVTSYELPKQVGELKPRQAFSFVIDEVYVATDDLDVATGIIGRADQAADSALKDSPVFNTVMSRLTRESGETTPHLRWFVDPFRCADVVRAANGGRTSLDKDLLQILKNQGFEAVQALAGHVNMATGKQEVLHRTVVYAPGNDGQDGQYEKAARMLTFPNGPQFPIEKWIPRNLATYLSWNWRIREAFEHSISLIDDYVDSPGFVEDVLSSFEKDGPRINARTELLDYMSQRVLLLSDYKLPITTKSERLLAAIEVTDEEQVAKALRKLWQTDAQANERRLGDQVVWEIVPEAEELIPDLEITGVPLPFGDAGPAPEQEELQLPSAAMTVAHGYLLVASHLDFLESVLAARPDHDTLGESVDFKVVNRHLLELGAGEESFRFFSRTDEEYRSAYEMIRRGEMPQSESLLGKMLNRLLGPEEKGVLREQQLDGKSLPDYQVVRRYLGPAGLYVQSQKDGWLVTGVLVSRRKLVEENVAALPLTTAATE